jgi:hypothetical protein
MAVFMDAALHAFPGIFRLEIQLERSRSDPSTVLLAKDFRNDDDRNSRDAREI